MSKEIIYIFIGGGTGSALRYCVQLFMHERIVPYHSRGQRSPSIFSAVFLSVCFMPFQNGSTFLLKSAYF